MYLVGLCLPSILGIPLAEAAKFWGDLASPSRRDSYVGSLTLRGGNYFSAGRRREQEVGGGGGLTLRGGGAFAVRKGEAAASSRSIRPHFQPAAAASPDSLTLRGGEYFASKKQDDGPNVRPQFERREDASSGGGYVRPKFEPVAAPASLRTSFVPSPYVDSSQIRYSSSLGAGATTQDTRAVPADSSSSMRRHQQYDSSLGGAATPQKDVLAIQTDSSSRRNQYDSNASDAGSRYRYLNADAIENKQYVSTKHYKNSNDMRYADVGDNTSRYRQTGYSFHIGRLISLNQSGIGRGNSCSMLLWRTKKSFSVITRGGAKKRLIRRR